MKKYTHKILIIVIVLCILAFTIRFFILANKVKKEIKQFKTNELTIK